MIKLIKACDLVTGMDVNLTAPVTQCVACIQGKHHMEPFPKWVEDAAMLVGDLSVSNVWGPANTEGPAWEWYFYSFTNAKSRYSIIYFSHAKDSILERFKEYATLIETQTGCQPCACIVMVAVNTLIPYLEPFVLKKESLWNPLPLTHPHRMALLSA